MDLQRLRDETAADHERTEASVPLLSDVLSRQQYACVLARMYGFVHGWERWAPSHVPPDLQPVLAARQRAGLIAQDLHFLGHSLPAAEASFPTGPVTRAQFLGRMYVMEGSTLGGQYLAAQMEKRFGLAHGEGNAYFVGYGPETGSMWNRFKQLLLELPETDAGTVIDSAKQMFAAFEQWMLAPGEEPGEPRIESGQERHA